MALAICWMNGALRWALRWDFTSAHIRGLVCALALAPVFASSWALDHRSLDHWTLDQLMQALAKAPPKEARFTEKKTFALLDRPVQSSGVLSYRSPDRLEKRTIKPKPETMVVQGDILTLQRGTHTFTLQLQKQPELAGLIDSIRGTLSGSRQALERSFKLHLEGPAESWTLTLFPIDAKLATNVHLIRIGGSQAQVSSIEVIQTDGDRSMMTITPSPVATTP